MFAHQGGWDEILMVLAPIAVFAGLLYIANKRAGALADDAEADDTDETDELGPTDESAGRQPS